MKNHRYFLSASLVLLVGGCTSTRPQEGAKTVTDIGTIVMRPAAAPTASAVFFEFDSANLSDAAKRELDRMAAWMATNPEHVTAIHGHTDGVGDANYNYRLGLERAKAVRDYLEARGADLGRINVLSHGEAGTQVGTDSLKRRALVVSEKIEG